MNQSTVLWLICHTKPRTVVQVHCTCTSAYMSAHWRAFCEKKVNILWLSHSLLQVHQSLLPVNISFLMLSKFLPISFSILLLLPLGIVLFLMVSLCLSLSLHLIIPFQLHETRDHIHTWQWSNITLYFVIYVLACSDSDPSLLEYFCLYLPITLI